MFIAGFLGNLLSQAARAALNFAVSTLEFALATMTLFVGVLMLLGGGREKGKASCYGAHKRIKKSARSLAVGLAQAAGAVTLVTPLLRGAQASSERFRMRGIYAPNSPNRTKVQSAFGLDAWEPAPEAPRMKKVERGPDLSDLKVENKKAIPSLADIRVEERGPIPRMKVVAAARPKLAAKNAEWESLARAYLESRTSRDADRIRLKMATQHPLLYLKALKTAGSRSRRSA